MTTSSPASREPPRGVLVDGFVGIVLRRGRDRDPARRDEPGEIVDMAVGMVVQQPLAEPHHPLEAEIVAQPLLDLLARQRVAVGVEQALLGGDDRARCRRRRSRRLRGSSRPWRRAGRRGAPAARRCPASPVRSYLPPQPLKPKPCARRAVPAAERRSARYRAARCRRTARRSPRRTAPARARFPPRRRAPRPARPVSPLPPAWTASANAATSRSAGFEVTEPQLGIARKADPHRLVRRPFGKRGLASCGAGQQSHKIVAKLL